MADGIRCKHCGGYEATHNESDANTITEVREGYSQSLAQCKGFVPEKRRLARQLKREHERQEYEQKMREFGHSI